MYPMVMCTFGLLGVWHTILRMMLLSGFNSHPGQSFSLSLCGPISISRANAHMVHMG